MDRVFIKNEMMNKRPVIVRKFIKFFSSPGIFFRDFLNKRYPTIRNEILCREDEELILIRHDLQLDNYLDAKFPIDVVFTWVNDKDPIWQDKYNTSKNINVDLYGQYATDEARFSNHNELYFSVQSVVRFLPWVRNIFIITDNQIPTWIDSFPKVKIIDHKEIISEEFLPTFNSHVIEAHLHRIPDLAEHFIYFNDDVFVARLLPKGHFFQSNGASSLFLTKKNIMEMKSRGVLTPTLNASLYANSLINRDFNESVEIPLVHTYIPLSKTMFKYAWDNYYDDIKSFLPNKFRTDKDLNLATFMVPWITYLKGGSVLKRDICYYFNIRSPVAKYYYAALTRFRSDEVPHSFCANDFTATKNNIEDYQSSLIKMLTKYYSKGK